MARVKDPNTRLAALLAEADVSNSGLAHRVVELAESRGMPRPSYNHASVARWISGQHPRGQVPDLIAEVLSTLTGRRLSRVDVGMPPGGESDTALDYSTDLQTAVDAAADLYGADVHRRHLLSKSTFSAAAYLVPALRWMTAPAAEMLEHRGTVHVGAGQVQAIRELTATFRRLDNQLGGGYARSTVVNYLADEVAPLLRHGTYTGPVGSELFAAASEMTLLAGWMAYDLEQHPVTQRYLIQALRLAQAAGEHALGGEILAAMAAQAAYLGDGAQVVDLARAAARSARHAGSGALLSESLAAEAHGHALEGDVKQCAIALAEAHRALDGSADEPTFLAYFDAAYLAAKTGRALLDCGDAGAAARSLRTSLSMKPGFERGRVFNLAVLAAALTQSGAVDEACATAREAAAGARPIVSLRVERELGLLAARLEPHGQSPVVAGALRALPSGRRGARALTAAR